MKSPLMITEFYTACSTPSCIKLTEHTKLIRKAYTSKDHRVEYSTLHQYIFETLNYQKCTITG